MNKLHLSGKYLITCIRDKHLIWSSTIYNDIVTTGKNNILDNYFSSINYTSSFFMGLIDNTGSTFSISDTMSSHLGWSENTSYTSSTRPEVSWLSAASGSKSSNSVEFTISSAFTLQGCFLSTSHIKGGTSGILFSAGAFTTGANRLVEINDILTVTYVISC